MPRIRQWMLVQRLGAAMLGAAAIVLAGSGIAQAQYGPPQGPIPVPGGYDEVVVSETIGTGGTDIGPVSGGGLEATFGLLAGTFPSSVQVTIVQPDVTLIGNAGFPGYTAVAGIGMVIQLPNGQDYNGFLLHPITITFSAPNLEPGDFIVAWNGSRFVRVPGVVIHDHMVTIRLDSQASRYQYFAVLSPTGSIVTGRAAAPNQQSPQSQSAQSQSAQSQPAAVPAPLRFGVNEPIFAEFFMPASGIPLPGFGVLAPRWLRGLSSLVLASHVVR
ncbi:MAG TPA: hypothetical protein VNF47_06365 [Streptosporangiaceae bacterium]|nr:hypothetical protein [Streptosporangiaceae bacterium]